MLKNTFRTWHTFRRAISTHGWKDTMGNMNCFDFLRKTFSYTKHFKNFLNFFLKDYVFIFIGRLDSFHSDMWGDKYREFYFASSSAISVQKLHMKFVFEPNFYNFKYWKSELGLDWLLQHFHYCDWHNSLLYHIY
jgi:hypothetical protein